MRELQARNFCYALQGTSSDAELSGTMDTKESS